MDDDPKLRKVLQTWQVTLPPVADFADSVWRRIAEHEGHARLSTRDALREWFLIQLPRPAYASVLLILAAALGVTAANVRAGHERERVRLENAREYLASIDPIAMNARASTSLR